MTQTGFLTPAEQYALEQFDKSGRLVLSGGGPDCERRAAFFLPEYMTPEDFDPGEYLRAVRLRAHFGTPGHRDYLGAALALGIKREALGDIRISGETAHLFCLPSVQPLLLEELTRVGRITVTAEACPLSEVPAVQVKVKAVTFTVKSLRFDAVLGETFGMSRTAAAEQIRLGAASLNYSVCDKTDAPVKEGDVFSLKGRGKACLKTVGGRSRKDRLFVEAEVYL